MYCQKCGAENKNDAKFCDRCGAGMQYIPVVPLQEESAPQPIVCKSCGNQTEPGDVYCKKCTAGIPVELRVPAKSPVPTISKHNTIIMAKIATKKQQINDISQVGPVILVILGILFCLTIFGIILGLIFIGVAIWWSSSRENEKNKLQSEIKELEVELE
jgi:uncharacterized membrane protein YvbJ